MPTLIYLGGSSEVYVPAAGVTAAPGVPVEVPADVAGRAPGPWRPKGADDPDGWPERPTEDGTGVDTHDPGEGLLAQADVWALAIPASTSAAVEIKED